MTVDCTVIADQSRLVAQLAGRLSLAEVSRLRMSLLKCLAEQPEALLIDMSGLTVGEPTALSVFSAVVRQAARWPGTPVLFCVPPGLLRIQLRSAASRRFLLFGSLSEARERLTAGRHAMPTRVEELLPIRGAARRGRDVATEACLLWDVPDLVAPVSLVCSELVSNVVDHVSTMMTLRLTLGDRFLLIAVRDGSPVEPVLLPPTTEVGAVGRGRGLQIVAATAHSWGFLPASDGKVVWASVPLSGS